MVKALITISSYNEAFYPGDGKTGLYVTEAIHPFNYFIEQGVEVQFASETGTFGIDAFSILPDYLNGQDKIDFENKESPFNLALNKVKKASDIVSSEYDIFYASAGHSTMFDYPTATGLQNIASDIWAKGGVVSAVCHAPTIFANLFDKSTGKLLITGKKITGFTSSAETLLGLDPLLDAKNLVRVEAVAESAGATFLAPPGSPFDEFTVTDGKLVTGSNPASATATAVAALKALKA